MPYLILIIGLIIGSYALFRFFAKASPAQIKAFFRIVIMTIYAMIMLFFAVTGRISISIILVVLAIPFVISYFKGKNKNKKNNKDSDDEQSN